MSLPTGHSLQPEAIYTKWNSSSWGAGRDVSAVGWEQDRLVLWFYYIWDRN